MTPLFLSVICERCDSEKAGEAFGWIVWRARTPGSTEYIFRTPEYAERWRQASGLDGFPIRRVITESPIRWRESSGTIRDLQMADRLFEIYPAVGYAPGANRAHLA